MKAAPSVSSSAVDVSDELDARLSCAPGTESLEAIDQLIDSRSSCPEFVVPYPGMIVDDRYRLLQLLGVGGMGWVFEAINLRTEKLVAIKYLKPDLRHSIRNIERFAKEARLAGRLDHPNIVQLYDVGGEGANLYLVMERLYGRTLRELVAHRKLELDQVLDIMLSVMRGVSEAHRHGVVHRDLKPDNVFMARLNDGSPDQPKIVDFGVSKMIKSALSTQSVSELALAGTPHYMPLEQLRGEAADERTDVYALGVMLYELLSGKRPYSARGPADLAVKLATESPGPFLLANATFSRRLNAVVAKAIARDRADRFASVAQLAEALVQARAPLSAAARLRSTLRRHLVAAAATSLVFVPGAERSMELAVGTDAQRSTVETAPRRPTTTTPFVMAAREPSVVHGAPVTAAAVTAMPSETAREQPTPAAPAKTAHLPKRSDKQHASARDLLLVREDF